MNWEAASEDSVAQICGSRYGNQRSHTVKIDLLECLPCDFCQICGRGVGVPSPLDQGSSKMAEEALELIHGDVLVSDEMRSRLRVSGDVSDEGEAVG